MSAEQIATLFDLKFAAKDVRMGMGLPTADKGTEVLITIPVDQS